MDFLPVENNKYPRAFSLNLGGKLYTLDAPKVMGILNLTPDSFFGESRVQGLGELTDRAGKMLEEGADILDLGAYSTRPGAQDISAAEEADRLVPAIEAIRTAFPGCVISADTFRTVIAESAIRAGANMVNDVSGGTLDPAMFSAVGRLGCPYILTHMRGTPQTMSQLTDYENLFKDLAYWFSERIGELKAAGVKDIIVDPGFGFAKNTEQNFELLRRFADFQVFNFPLLAGISRKGMIWKTLDIGPEEALNGTTVLNTWALLHGASIIRVHDVKAAVECRTLVEKLKGGSQKY